MVLPKISLKNSLNLDLLIEDPELRLNSLYQIVGKNGTQQLFRPNWAQQELLDSLWYCNLILKARQLGISTFICLLLLDRCLFNSNVAAGIICQTREDSEAFFKRIKFAYDNLPPEIRSLRHATNDSARELMFNNGSSLRVGTSMRGATFQYLHISEFGKICAHYPDKAREIITGSLNTLQAGQYVFIESTAEGREGYFFDLCKQAQALKHSGKHLSKMDFRFHFFPWWRCPDYTLDRSYPIPSELSKYFEELCNSGIKLTGKQQNWYVAKWNTQQDDTKREFPSTPDDAFETSGEGAYYASQLTKARLHRRICRVPYNEDLPVHTAWDLGYGDSTAIWWFQIAGKELHVLEYYESNQQPLTFYLKLLKSKDYSYGRHLAPHDIGVHEFSSGLSRQEIAARHGVNFLKVPDAGLNEGIDAVRLLLNRCWFDEAGCSQGLRCLDSYRRQWDDRNGCWKGSPLHNGASHGADAFRMLAVGLNFIVGDEMDDRKSEQLRMRAIHEEYRLQGTDLPLDHPL